MGQPNYILHAAPEWNKEGKNIHKAIRDGGLQYITWRPTASSDVSYATLHAVDLWKREWEKPDTQSQLWHIFCMDLPSTHQVKTSIHWNITVLDNEENAKYGRPISSEKESNEQKEIHGKPTTRMSGRAQWGIYDAKEHQKWVKNTFTQPTTPKKTLPKENIALELIPTPELTAIAQTLREQITDFKQIDVASLKSNLLYALKKSIFRAKEWIDLDKIADDLLFSTLEARCTAFIRTLFLASADKDNYTMFVGNKGKEKSRNVRERYGKENTEKLIAEFPQLLAMVNTPWFTLFKDSKYENLDRYLRFSINQINRKFWNK